MSGKKAKKAQRKGEIRIFFSLSYLFQRKRIFQYSCCYDNNKNGDNSNKSNEANNQNNNDNSDNNLNDNNNNGKSNNSNNDDLLI